MTANEVCRVLQPLFDLGDVRELNGPTGTRLAELILPHSAADLTVGRVLELIEQAGQETYP